MRNVVDPGNNIELKIILMETGRGDNSGQLHLVALVKVDDHQEPGFFLP